MVGASAVKVIGSVSVAWRAQGYDVTALCFDYVRRGIRSRHVALNPRYEVTCIIISCFFSGTKDILILLSYISIYIRYVQCVPRARGSVVG
jgi:hypothetical protein